MSLVPDNLKKIRKQKEISSVPPNILSMQPKKNRGRMPDKGLLVLLAVSLVGAGIVFFMDSGGDYKVTKPAGTQSVPKSEALTQILSPEEIQAKIDAAVKEALAKAERDRAEQMQSIIDAGVKRAENFDLLPKSFVQQTVPKVPSVPVPDAVKKTQGRENKPLVKESKETAKIRQDRPVLSEKQRAVFDGKVRYNTLMILGKRALASKEYPKAAEKFQSALAIRPSEAALLNLIKAKIGTGDSQSISVVFAEYDNAVSLKVVTAAALDLEKAGFEDDAISMLTDYSGRFPSDGMLYYTRGQILERKREFADAEKAYRKALNSFPADALMQYAYARMLDVNMKLEQALEVYAKVSGLDVSFDLKKNASDRAVTIYEYLKHKEGQENTVISSGGPSENQ